VAQWWRSCWWKKPGVQAACTDRSRVMDTRRVPVRSRGSRTFVQIEAGGFYPRFYGRYVEIHMFAGYRSSLRRTIQFVITTTCVMLCLPTKCRKYFADISWCIGLLVRKLSCNLTLVIISNDNIRIYISLAQCRWNLLCIGLLN